MQAAVQHAATPEGNHIHPTIYHGLRPQVMPTTSDSDLWTSMRSKSSSEISEMRHLSRTSIDHHDPQPETQVTVATCNFCATEQIAPASSWVSTALVM